MRRNFLLPWIIDRISEKWSEEEREGGFFRGPVFIRYRLVQRAAHHKFDRRRANLRAAGLVLRIINRRRWIRRRIAARTGCRRETTGGSRYIFYLASGYLPTSRARVHDLLSRFFGIERGIARRRTVRSNRGGSAIQNPHELWRWADRGRPFYLSPRCGINYTRTANRAICASCRQSWL